MGAKDILPPKGIKVTVAGETKILRFTIRSLAWLADRYGTITEVFGLFAAVEKNLNSMDSKVLHAIADLIYAAMMSNDPAITPEIIETTFDLADITEMMPAVMEAFLQAAGKSKDEKKNPRKA